MLQLVTSNPRRIFHEADWPMNVRADMFCFTKRLRLRDLSLRRPHWLYGVYMALLVARGIVYNTATYPYYLTVILDSTIFYIAPCLLYEFTPGFDPG